jgi:hypothetical protein
LFVADLSPFDFFRQEMVNNDAIVRTEAMSKVHLIAALMTPIAAKNELIPFLESKFVVNLLVCMFLLSSMTLKTIYF